MLYDRLVFRLLLIAVLVFTALAQSPSRPEWVKDGMVMASNTEALSFVHWRGGHAANCAEPWEGKQTEQAVCAPNEQGVNAVLISPMKGAGLKAEAEDIELARRYVELGHKHGLRVGGYIGGSIFFETMFAGEPGSRDWIQLDETGRPLFYRPNQTFRYLANPNHPGYRCFIERVLAHLVSYKVATPVFGPVVKFDVPGGKRLMRAKAESQNAPRRRSARRSRTASRRFGSLGWMSIQ